MVDDWRERTLTFMWERHHADTSGHDAWHVERVWKLAKHLQQHEGGNLFIIELSALLHDVDDRKLHPHPTHNAESWLQQLPVDEATCQQILEVIAQVSFKGAGVHDRPTSLEAQIVQDADRLDAIGAIGIARAFAYGGHSGQALHDPQHTPHFHATTLDYHTTHTTTINHFHEKLLLLKDRLNTREAQRLAERRHATLVEFLRAFHAEWDLSE
ncbi:MAG: HD domain-containing protein [Phototrophicaceae bacterium]